MKKGWINGALMIALAQGAAAADFPVVKCSAHPDKGAYWSWRQIDNRQCWFRGHATMPKNRLFWEKTPEPTKVAVPESVSEPTVVTIDVRRGTAFEWVWRNLIIDFNARAWMDPTRVETWRMP